MLEGKEGDKNLILHCDASTDTVSIVMPCSMTGLHSVRSEKFIVRQFCCYANTIECTYTNIDGTAYCTTRLCGIAYCS